MENKFEGLLSESEMNEIKNLLQSKDNFELVMIRRGIIQVCADIEYHFGIFAVDYFFGALDIELAKRNVYDFAKCTFVNAVTGYEKAKARITEGGVENLARFLHIIVV